MSCKAAIYTANTGAQAVAVGGTIGLGSIIRRFGNSCCNPIINLNGSGITLDEPGYYKVSVSAVANPTAAGPVTLALFQDGVAVPGGVATGTAAAAGDAVNLNMEAIVKVRCGSTGSLTVQLRSQLEKNKEILMDEIERLSCEKMNETTATRLSVYRGAYKALCLSETEDYGEAADRARADDKPAHTPELDGDTEFERVIMSIPTDRAHYIKL